MHCVCHAAGHDKNRVKFRCSVKTDGVFVKPNSDTCNADTTAYTVRTLITESPYIAVLVMVTINGIITMTLLLEGETR